MADVRINIDVDKELKEDSEELFHNLGLTLTSAITVFLRQAVREQGFPFTPSCATGRALTERALADSQNDVDIHGPFNTFAEMMADIHADS